MLQHRPDLIHKIIQHNPCKLGWFLLVLVLTLVATVGCRPKVRREKANVLLITIDTLRADRLGAYGYPYIQTPVIDGLADEGILFERVMTAVPLTLPSHTTIMTGLYPPSHGVRDNSRFQVPEKITTLAEILRDKGYRTSAVIGAYVLDRNFKLNQGFEMYDDSGMTKEGIEKSVLFPERPADKVTDHALAWLVDRKKSEPFFMWVHYYDPHAVYRPPPPFDKEYATSKYDGEIAFVDTQLKRLLEGVRKASGNLPLLVVLVADHGESLGEHGEMSHGVFVYNSSIHVPLIISCPAMLPKGMRIAAQVRTVDVAPTILDMLGFAVPGWMQGESLISLVEGKNPDKDRPAYMETELPLFQYGWSDLVALSEHGYVYIESPRPELYNIKSDFAQKYDLADIQPDKVRRMGNLLKSLERKISWDSYQHAARSENSSIDASEKLAALGYMVLATPTSESTKEESIKKRPIPADLKGVNHAHTKAIFLIAEGKYLEAATILQELLKNDPHNPNFLFLCARAFNMNKRPDEAKKYLLQAIQENPKFSAAYGFLAKIEYGEGNIEKAKELYKIALEISPISATLYRQLGKIVLGEGNKEEAKKLFERALELSPRDIDALELLEGILSEDGEIDKVVELLDRALEKAPTETYVLRKAALLRSEKLKDRDGAVELFRKVVQLNPRSASARFNLGAAMLLGHNGKRFGPGADLRSALRLFHEALELDPEFEQARKRIKLVKLYVSGKLEEAP